MYGMEPLPEAPLPLPDEAPHLLARMNVETGDSRLQSSVRQELQRQVQRIVDSYARQYSSNHVYNLSALVADIETGETLAYAGNVSFKGDEKRGNQVDIITSPRSVKRTLPAKAP